MLEIHVVPVTPFMQNSTLLVCTETRKAAVCDCGDAGPILMLAERLEVEIEKVIATHGHLDHIGGTAELKAMLGVPFHFPRGDDYLREGLVEQAMMYGFPPVQVPEVDHDVLAGETMTIGNVELEVRACPGHSRGHVVYYDAEGGQVIVGDVLFQGSIGRTDLPGGDFKQLEASIRTQLYSLPPETVVHSGHGPTTTIGQEAATNPFVQA